VAAYPPEELAHIEQVLNGEFDLINGQQVGLVGIAFKGGESKIFTGLKRTPSRHPQHIRLHSETQSELVALIRDQDSLIVGAITVENSDEDAFDSDDLNVMETLARQAGVAIQKDKQTAVLEKLNRDIARKRAVSLVGVSTSIWRHKINNSANSIYMAAEQCLQQKASQVEEFKWTTNKLKEIAAYAQDLKKMPVGVPIFAREDRPNKAVNVMIRDHLNNLKANQENRAVNIRAELLAPEGTTVKINEEWFHAALSFFTQNSLRAIKNSATKQLVLKTMVIQDGWCRIEVSDTGPGMDNQTWARLFEPKAGTPNSEGMGVGLLNAEFIIDEHGGVVHRVSNSPNGVTVGFSLPTVS
jgi:C4-dicarboxylate-specific signal transduction histidine kinase